MHFLSIFHEDLPVNNPFILRHQQLALIMFLGLFEVLIAQISDLIMKFQRESIL